MNLRQGIDLGLQILGLVFKNLVLLDVLLHRRDIDIEVCITDVFGDEGGDVGDRSKGYSLLEQHEILVGKVSESNLDESLIFSIGIKEAEVIGLVFLSHIRREFLEIHRTALVLLHGDSEVVFRELRVQIEVMLIDTIGRIDIKTGTDCEIALLHIVIDFNGDIGSEGTFTENDDGVIVLDASLTAEIGDKVTAASSLFIGGLVEVIRSCGTENDNLQSIDDSGFTSTIRTGKEGNILDISRDIAEIMPVDQTEFCNAFHYSFPPSLLRSKRDGAEEVSSFGAVSIE